MLDPFAGSGTTLMAAEASGRRAALVEVDPAYCDVIVRRFLEATGGAATLESTGQTFEETAAERAGADAERAA